MHGAVRNNLVNLNIKAMKKLVFIALISVMSGFAMKAEKVVAKGNTNNALGKYVIEKTDDLVELDGQALPTYIIRYENTDQTIKVAVDKDRKGTSKKFIVLSDNLNMQYNCEDTYFGVAHLERKYVKAGVKSDSKNLNREEFYHQKVLTRSNPSDRNCLGLIASYYPVLVNDYEKEFGCVN